jgi:transcriptional regulator with XRE-family HTH domain
MLKNGEVEMVNIGKKLLKLRTEKGLSLRDLGKEVHLSHSYIDAIEKSTTNPSIPSLELIANYFGVDVAYFLSEDNEEVIFYNEPNILEKLPKDLQEFVVKEENVPYLIVAKQLEAYDLSKLTEIEMKFLIDWLKMAIEKNNNK